MSSFSPGLYLFFQPVIILDYARHGNISTLHIESDLSCRLLLNHNINSKQKHESITKRPHRLQHEHIILLHCSTQSPHPDDDAHPFTLRGEGEDLQDVEGQNLS